MPEENAGKFSESDEFLQSTIDALNGYIAILDNRGNILKINRAWSDLAGLNSKNYSVGSNYIDECRELISDPVAVRLADGIVDVINKKKPFFEIEYPYQTPNESRWYVTRVVPIGEDENQRIIVTHENITTRKSIERALRESEESYRILAQTASDVIIKIDAESKVIFINSASERVFGYKPEEIIGKSLMMLIPDHLRESHRNGIKQYLQTGKQNMEWQSLELPALHKDGHIFPLEISFGEFRQEEQHYFIAVARDISERKQTEKATAYLAAIVKSSDDGIISKDLNGIITSWNKTAERIFGYTAEEIIGKPVLTLIPPHLHNEETLILSRIRNGEAVEYFETVRRRKDGTDISIALTVSPIQDEAGNIIGASKIVRDITEKLRNEEMLRQNQMMLSLAMQSSRMGAWERDLATETVIWSEELEEIFGLEAGAFGQTLEAYNKLVHEEDRERIRQEVDRAVSEHREYSIEFRFHHADGSIRWMEGRGQAVYSDKDEPVRLYGIGIDITERKHAQEALLKAERKAAEDYQTLLSRIVPLAQTFGTAGNLLTIYREVGSFIRASMPCSAFFISFYDAEKNLRIAAYVSGEKGEVDVSTLPPMKLTEDGGPNSQAIFGKKSVVANSYMDFMKSRPHVILQEDGINPNSSLVVPMKVMNRVLGTLEVQAYEDNAFTNEHIIALEMVANLAAVAIENVRLLEVEAKARQEAEAANRAKDEFLSVLSHELRTPLNAILGWMRMLKSGILDAPRTEQAIDTIERNARLQNNLIEDLLDVSRIISGKMLIEKEDVDIVSIVKSAVETANPAALEKNISLSFQSDFISKNLNGDATRLQQVINNLLNNAVKFTPSGGFISVTIKQQAGKIQIKVKDSGIGISPEFLPLIFDRFRQADSTTRRSHSGLGLGLTIVRHLTELHGGTIEVSSAGENLGSTFKIELPVSGSSTEILSAPENFLQIKNASNIKGARILLVDDDSEGVQPLQILLETQQAEVYYAVSASDALEKISEHQFDILVSDIGMPEIDGYELISQARRITDGKYFLPAIAVTAYASAQDRERALSAGFQTHLSKPIDFEQFIAAINNLLNNRGRI